MNSNVTVIINTYPNPTRKEDLIRCINSIIEQSYKNWEILIIENNKDNLDIKPILEKFKDVPIRLITDSKKKLSYLFNLGWKNSTNEYLAYIADDAEANKYWLENILKELGVFENIGIVTGPIISTSYPAGEMHRLYLLSQKNNLLKALAYPYLHFAMEDQILAPGKLFKSGAYSLGASLEESKGYSRQEIDLATTTSMGIKRSLLEKLEGFNEEFIFNHADGDIFIRAKKAGYKIIFDSTIVAYHHVRLGPSRNAYFIGKDTGVFYRKNIRPKTLNSFIGTILNILILNFYWIFKFFITLDFKNLLGIYGFIKGLFNF